MTGILLAFGAAVGLALIHLLAGRMRFLDVVPRSRWLSIGGGISVAYVFVHLLPELSEAQVALSEAVPGGVVFLERHAYLLALVGLAVFYGIERASRRSRSQRRRMLGQDEASPAVAWLAIGSYAAYNGLVGYLLVHRLDAGSVSLVLFAAAMGVHFVVNDRGLRAHHGAVYHQRGRWLCAAAVLAGWAVGAIVEVPDAARALLLSFLAGGVVLNVLKEELPEERDSRFTAFALGAAGYAALLLAV